MLDFVSRLAAPVALASTCVFALLVPAGAVGSAVRPGEYTVIRDVLNVAGTVPNGPVVGSLTRGRTFLVTRLSASREYAYGHISGKKRPIRGWVLAAALNPLVFHRCKRTSKWEAVRVQGTDCARGRAVDDAWRRSSEESGCVVGWTCILTVHGEDWRCTATIDARHNGHVHGRIGCYQLPSFARIRINYVGHPV